MRSRELVLARGVAVSYETIRRWCAKFGQAYANGLRRRRPRPGDKWHLDEVFVKINGTIHYLWRAVDQRGNVLDVFVQSRRNAMAAKRFFRKLAQGPAVCAAGDRHRQAPQLRSGASGGDGLGRAPAIEIPEPGGELPPADPATRPGDETLHISWARATLPVRFLGHFSALSAPSTPAVSERRCGTHPTDPHRSPTRLK